MEPVQRDWVLELEEAGKVTSLEMQHYVRKMKTQLEFNAAELAGILGYKKAEDDPYYNIEERIPVGSVVKGTVVRLTNFGAFVQLEPDLDALCHVSQISSVRLQQPSDVLKVGQEVIAKVIDIKPEERRISISIKEVEPIDPEPSDDDMFEISENAEAAEE